MMVIHHQGRASAGEPGPRPYPVAQGVVRRMESISFACGDWPASTIFSSDDRQYHIKLACGGRAYLDGLTRGHAMWKKSEGENPGRLVERGILAFIQELFEAHRHSSFCKIDAALLRYYIFFSRRFGIAVKTGPMQVDKVSQRSGEISTSERLPERQR